MSRTHRERSPDRRQRLLAWWPDHCMLDCNSAPRPRWAAGRPGLSFGGIVAIQEDDLGELGDGRRIARFTLESPGGLRAQIATYGGALVSLAVPDRTGRLDDVVLGFDDLAGYVAGRGY